MTLDNVMKS